MLISAVELLKQSVNLYRNNFVTILKFLSLLVIPVVIDLVVLVLFKKNPTVLWLQWLLFTTQIITKIIYFWFIFNIFRVIYTIYKKEAVASVEITTKETKKILWKGIGTSLVVGLFTFVPFIIIFVVFLYRFGDISEGVAENIIGGIRAIVIYLPLFVIYSPYMAIATVFSTIFAIFFGIKLSFATYETVIAGRSIKESIKFSWAITHGRWWTILWCFVLTAFVVSLVYALISAPLSQIFGVDLIYNIFIEIVSLLLTPIAFATAIILYEELKKLGPAQTIQKI